MINIESDDYKGKAIIQNGQLRSYYERVIDVSGYSDYKGSVGKLITDGDVLKIPGNSGYFQPVLENKKVLRVAKKGIKAFIKHYFIQSYWLKDNVTPDEERAIIYQLFEFGIASNRYCHTGFDRNDK